MTANSEWRKLAQDWVWARINDAEFVKRSAEFGGTYRKEAEQLIREDLDTP